MNPAIGWRKKLMMPRKYSCDPILDVRLNTECEKIESARGCPVPDSALTWACAFRVELDVEQQPIPLANRRFLITDFPGIVLPAIGILFE